jgi:hypothetical protein
MKLVFAHKDVDFDALETMHLNAWEQCITRSLRAKINSSSGAVRLFYERLLFHKRKLLIGKPVELRKIKKTLEKYRRNIPKNRHGAVNVALSKIFNYKTFERTTLPKWGAYYYTKSLDINSCLYCNRIFTFTLDRVEVARLLSIKQPIKKAKRILRQAKGKTRPELDHFYPKAQFPYLAISLYNLVPSCHICNSSLKGSRRINFDNIMHPFEMDFHDAVRIKAKLRKEEEIQNKINAGLLKGKVSDYFGYQLFTGKLDSFDLVFEVRDTTAPTNKKMLRHIDLYALTELYDLHKPHAIRIIKSAIAHGNAAAQDLYNRHRTLFHSVSEAKSALLGNEVNPDEINKSPLAKLTIDIAEEFGLL